MRRQRAGFRFSVSHRNLKERMVITARFKRRAADRIRARSHGSVNFQIKTDILSCLKRRKEFSFCCLKRKPSGSRRNILRLRHPDSGRFRMQFLRNLLDMVVVKVLRAAAFNQLPSCVNDAVCAEYISEKSMDFHFPDASFFICSRIIVAAIFPLLILHAMPSPTS